MAAFVLTISLGALMLVPCCLKRGGPTARLIAAPFSRHSGAGSIPSARMLASGGGGSGAAAASSAEQRGRYVSSIEDAAASLRAGGLVAFPTETVYGLGAHAFDADAVASIFTVKGRPRSDPLIVHVPSPEAAEELVRLDDDGLAVMRQLAAAFWPGPLTLVARACPELPPAVTAGTGFVGVRCPAHARATELLRAAGVPVAAPSANRFGHVSPTKPEHVMDDLGGHEIMVLLPSPTPSPSSAAAACDVGIESTVLKVDGEAKELLLLRRGGVPEAELARWLAAHAATTFGYTMRVQPPKHSAPPPVESGQGQQQQQQQPASVETPAPHAGTEEAQIAPGMLLTHYAPDLPSFLLELCDGAGGTEAAAGALGFPVEKAVVLDYGARLAHLRKSALAYRDLSSAADASEAATVVFDALRWAEGCASEGATCVLLPDVASPSAQTPQPSGSGGASDDHAPALADRLYRAASGRSARLTEDGVSIVVNAE